MNFDGWTEISSQAPQPPKGKKYQLLIMGEGSYIGPSQDSQQLEFNLKPEGIKKIVAWKEIE